MYHRRDCAIPTVWCGDGKRPGKKDVSYYYRTGTRGECLKKGVGVGMAIERGKSLPKTSLQTIKYVGEKYEAKFISKHSIQTTTQLRTYTKSHTSIQLQVLLRDVFTRRTKGLDRRAYNSTLMYLHTGGVRKRNLPACERISYE